MLLLSWKCVGLACRRVGLRNAFFVHLLGFVVVRLMLFTLIVDLFGSVVVRIVLVAFFTSNSFVVLTFFMV